MSAATDSQLETIAAAFRSALIPAVAKKTPWPKLTAESQQTYADATEAAMLKIILPIVTAAGAEQQAERDALLRFVEQQGFTMDRDGWRH